ncbi:hypothetical protein PHYBLDRAFT_66458 [Phycomyces blakesleeanus NRRL 1555(-)]|uniref:Uncharacterized protein n=1 Tax=Phycomyces blakesleeanus (strain ATCC 8743b / DSM 1359 / FGSC 10004 / NBRC 33097 / NRRL 1555) TaxID=763407 RepID=A0A167LX20_PHYB8|nr:hypothetical protein PHYBLDRAFT_66458 [Phycomyces blakesleeanus NRRL 1555(-)]OAD71264.1 hypothetical protein PHYBLDRAFT_66458 [Phycomyces blakesleeanus NRRL 1555(-)]|eukprot:XP_018289304.1 hypothetical protein PHYBLDRAFT_66458 [Phycomyces blakesleeanus NRRL 1555(-)]
MDTKILSYKTWTFGFVAAINRIWSTFVALGVLEKHYSSFCVSLVPSSGFCRVDRSDYQQEIQSISQAYDAEKYLKFTAHTNHKSKKPRLFDMTTTQDGLQETSAWLFSILLRLQYIVDTMQDIENFIDSYEYLIQPWVEHKPAYYELSSNLADIWNQDSINWVNRVMFGAVKKSRLKQAISTMSVYQGQTTYI